MTYETTSKKLMDFPYCIPSNKNNSYLQANMPQQTFNFPTYIAIIELTDSNTVKWLFQHHHEKHCYCNEYNITNIPDSFGGIANFYYVAVALHESFLNGKCNVGTLIYGFCDAYVILSICYDNGIKLECNTTLKYYSKNPMEVTTTPSTVTEETTYYIRYCKEICNLLPNTVKGVKFNNTRNGGNYVFTCKNFEELQTHIDVFRQIHPKFTYENLVSILECEFYIADKKQKGIHISPSTKTHTDYTIAWTKKQLLIDEIHKGLKQLAYDRMLAKFK